ncbi:hypothetical protein BC832DRAFT_595317 [Gaertneriomyces semiglobifer]|nr:hypothetical protein BC832DRAFT_595317 [Gaertneriomyces semiglobifer]
MSFFNDSKNAAPGAASGDSEYLRTAIPPSSTVRHDIAEFAEASPNKQQKIADAEAHAYAEKMSERYPLTQKTHAQYESSQAAQSTIPQHVKSVTERSGNIIDSAENPFLHASGMAQRELVDRTGRNSQVPAHLAADRLGKMRVDTFGMADTLNQGELADQASKAGVKGPTWE